MATRRERVVLDLEDNFSKGMAEAAGKTALLNRELGRLDKNTDRNTKSTDNLGVSLGKLNAQIDGTNKGTKGLADQAIPRLGRQSESSGKQIDKLSGRMRLLAEAAFTLGPALVPIGASIVPAISGLAMGFTAAAGAAGVAVLAFKGVGEALKAVDAYQLDPTTANLEKMQAAMDSLGPSGAEFVRFLDSIEPQLRSLQFVARDGLFPGVEDGISSLLTMLPQVRAIVSSIATEMGSLASQAGAGLAGDGFTSFFRYLETDAAPTLAAFGHTIGNLAEGFANLLVAFAPLSRSFNAGMESMSRSFADWATGLSQTDGFRDFVAYVQDSGPRVADLLGSLANAFVGIITAAAPLGSVLLPALTGLLNVLGAIANSPIGPSLYTGVAALLAINRIVGVASSGMEKLKTSSDKTSKSFSRLAGTAAGVAAVGIAVGALADGIGRIDSANLDRSLTALGQGQATDTIDKVISSMEQLDGLRNKIDLGEIVTAGGLFGDTTLDKAADNIDQLDQKLAQMVETGDKVAAQQLFAKIMAQAKASGVDVKDAAKMFDAYGLAVSNAAGANRGYASATQQSAAAARVTRSSITSLMNAMKAQRLEALAGFDAQTAYGQALADARKQARGAANGIDASTKAGRANRTALSGLAGAWNNQSAAVKNNINKFAEARGAFIRTATAMGVPRRAAEQLADKLMEIPRTVTTKVTVNTATALSALATARAQLNSMNGLTATMFLTTVRSGPGGIGDGTDRTSADGGTVPKTGRAYADRFRYLLADGEEVISNRYGQADRHRSLLKAINANRLADGGTAARYAAAAHSVGGGSSASRSTVEHVVTVRVHGEMDLARAKAQIQQIASDASRSEVDDSQSFVRTLGRQGVPN